MRKKLIVCLAVFFLAPPVFTQTDPVIPMVKLGTPAGQAGTKVDYPVYVLSREVPVSQFEFELTFSKFLTVESVNTLSESVGPVEAVKVLTEDGKVKVSVEVSARVILEPIRVATLGIEISLDAPPNETLPVEMSLVVKNETGEAVPATKDGGSVRIISPSAPAAPTIKK